MHKYLKITLTILLLSALAIGVHSQMTTVQARMTVVTAGGGVAAVGGVTYDLSETWDGSTEDTVWRNSTDDSTTLPADWNDDSTNSIDGAQALETSATTGMIYTSLATARGNFYAVAKMKNLDTESGSGDAFRLVFAQADGTAICSLRLYYQAGDDTWYRIYAYHSGDTTSGGTISLSPALTASSPIVVKMAYQKGTGANGVVSVWVDTWANYASDGWSGAQGDTDNAATTDQADVGRVYLYAGTAGQGMIIDTVRGNGTDNVDY